MDRYALGIYTVILPPLLPVPAIFCPSDSVALGLGTSADPHEAAADEATALI